MKLILYRLLELVSKKLQGILSFMSCIVQSDLYRQCDREIAGLSLPRNSFLLYSGLTYATQGSFYAIKNPPLARFIVRNGHEEVPRRHRNDLGQLIDTNRLKYS